MDLYINGTGLICAAGSNAAEDFPETDISWYTDRLDAKEPDYTGLIPPMQLRRMSKAVRMGVAAAKTCLQQSGVETPDALSVGTALGCLQDTEQFLGRMIEREEQQLTPTSFIQSTHNTVAGQIALLLGCNGHNLTFVHRGHSFEHALLNAKLYLNEHPEHVVLAGGIDELTDTSVLLMQRGKVYRDHPASDTSLYTDLRKGSIAGEGAGFFTVTSRPLTETFLHLKALHFFVARTEQETRQQLDHFIASLPVREDDIDFVLLGMNGDERWSGIYDYIRREHFRQATQSGFKHLSGEYATAGAIGLGLLMYDAKAVASRRVVFINNYLDHYSCWYLERFS